MRTLLGLGTLALILACSGGKDEGGGLFGDDTGDDGGGGLIPRDEDDDGFRDNVDCDDSDASVNPDAAEVPYDGVDNDRPAVGATPARPTTTSTATATASPRTATTATRRCTPARPRSPATA